jgi:hypothetical protein
MTINATPASVVPSTIQINAAILNMTASPSRACQFDWPGHRETSKFIEVYWSDADLLGVDDDQDRPRPTDAPVGGVR